VPRAAVRSGRAGNVVRILRRSEPGVSGVWRRTIELVFVGPFVTHIELFWTIPEFKAFFDQLARFCRVLLFDKAGIGLSDPVPHVRTVDDRATEIEAVMDAVGFGRAVLFGMSDGGFASIVFAATRPERPWRLLHVAVAG
jgi:pimeloyl-ACP methyl ester carboxylesterase